MKTKDTFADPDYFKTVFISGDGLVKEQLEAKQKEIDEFNRKLVVENKYFSVNKRAGSGIN